MRILYLAPDPVPAPKGAGVRIERTVRTLLALGHEVALFTPASDPERRLEGVDHHTVPLPQEEFLDRMVELRRAAGAWLREREADVVQFRSIWEGMAAVAEQRGRAKLVYEAHGFPSVELPYHFPGLRSEDAFLAKLIHEERVVLDAAERLITPSRTGARFLQMRGVEPGRIAVVPNAVDGELFSPAESPPPDEPPWRIVYQGTQAPWQGLDALLEALSRMRGVPFELHVVGPARSPWRRRLRALARRLRVHHSLQLSRATGQTDLVPVLRSAHVCVAPLPADPRNALQGCCPIKLLEYMAVGRPILSTAIAPVEEILEHECTAWLARPGSPAALGDGLRWMLEHADEREAMGLQAREAALRDWSGEVFGERLARALEGLA
jgi:glycosyltransferase involved in cell wall biosynthesis